LVVAELPDDHHCPWREEAERLRGELVEVRAELVAVRAKLAAVMTAMEALERRVLGPKSEKVPPPEKELRKEESAEDAEARRLAALERRRERAALKEKLRAQTVTHPLEDEQRQCPKCGGVADRPLGDGKQTHLYEYVPGHFVRQCHVQEKAACRCGQFYSCRSPG
jgi:transposase